MVKGSWTGLMLVVAVVWCPMAQAHFLSPDPKLPTAGNIFGFNRYVYANNNPVTNLDPDGRDCTTSNRVTTCTTAMYRVQFPAQPGFKDFTTSSPNYHFYSVPVNTPGHTVTEDQNYLVQNQHLAARTAPARKARRTMPPRLLETSCRARSAP